MKNVVVKIIGREDYLNVTVRDTSNFYFGDMSKYLQIDIGGYGHYEARKGAKFDFIEVEIYFNNNEKVKDYYPATYKNVRIEHATIKDYFYNDGEVEKLEYETDIIKNCYIVKIPFELYIRDDLYRSNDEIYVGIVPNL